MRIMRISSAVAGPPPWRPSRRLTRDSRLVMTSLILLSSSSTKPMVAVIWWWTVGSVARLPRLSWKGLKEEEQLGQLRLQ